MAQLKEDEWPADDEPTTQEQEVARDPIDGPKDPHDSRKPYYGTRLRDDEAPRISPLTPELPDDPLA